MKARLLGVLLVLVGLLAACGGSGTTATSEAGLSGYWTKLPAADPAPSPRSGMSLVYDADHVQMLLFGGWDNDTDFGDTWSYDLDAATWTDQKPGGTLPAPRALYQAVWDAAAARLVLFGGTSDAGRFGDTWTFDPTADVWTETAGAGAPQARSAHAMVYDSDAGRVLMFGGVGDAGRFGDTWTYDTASGLWSQVAAEGASPSVRSGHAMVYVPDEKMTLLFGGYDGTKFLNDTWAYDSQASTWTELSPVGAVPSARGNHRMVYDPENGVVVLFGGNDGSAELADVWTYDLAMNTWQRLDTPGDVPPGREEHALVYDPSTGGVLLFGGFDNSDADLADLWELNIGR